MKKNISICLFIALCMFITTNVSSEGVRYEFAEVEVLYGAEFTAVTKSIDGENWLVQLAGGNEKKIDVLYGVVNLIGLGSDVFIKVTGENGSRRFLRNSASFEYNQDSSKITQIKLFFWSAKTIVDNEVVKNFQAPIEGIFIVQNFNEEGKISDMKIIASSGTKEELVGLEMNVFNSFSEEIFEEINVFEADMSTLNETGDAQSAIQ
jgi:hypothetical protein